MNSPPEGSEARSQVEAGVGRASAVVLLGLTLIVAGMTAFDLVAPPDLEGDE